MRATVRAVSTHDKTQAEADTPLTFRLTAGERDSLKAIAERNHRSMTGQLRAWIADAGAAPDHERKAA